MFRNWRRASAWTFAVALGVLAVLCLSLCTGCGGKGGNEEVAVIDGSSLTEADLLEALDESQRAMVGMWAIRKVLVEAEATRWGVEASESEVQAAFEMEQERAGGAEQYAAVLQQSGMTPEGRFAQIPTEILVKKILVRDVADKTDDELTSFLEEYASSFGGHSPRVELCGVVCESEENARKAADRLSAGDDAASVAKALGMQGGFPAEPTWMDYAQLGSPELIDAVKAGEAGTVVGPVQLAAGFETPLWVVCKIGEKQAGDIPDLESVRALVTLEAKMTDESAEDEGSFLRRLFLEHKVEVVGEGYESLAEAIAQMSQRATGPEAGQLAIPPAGEGAAAPPAEGPTESAAAPAPAETESAQ